MVLVKSEFWNPDTAVKALFEMTLTVANAPLLKPEMLCRPALLFMFRLRMVAPTNPVMDCS